MYSYRVETLGEIVKAGRKALGLNQRQFGTLVGVSHTYIYQIEAGKTNIPSPGVIAALAKALGAPEVQLLQSVGYFSSAGPDGIPESVDDILVLEKVLERIMELPTPAAQRAAFRALPSRTQQLLRSVGAIVLLGDSDG